MIEDFDTILSRLNQVRDLCDLLLQGDDPLDEEQRQDIGTISSSTEHCLRLAATLPIRELLQTMSPYRTIIETLRISTEWRTPLSSIVGFSDVTLRGSFSKSPLSDVQRKALQQIFDLGMSVLTWTNTKEFSGGST